MVREKLGPKLRPPQTLYLLGEGETQFLGRENSDHGLSFGCFWGRVDEGALISSFQSFSGFAVAAGQITGISLKAVNSSKKSVALLDLPFPEVTQ